MFIASKSDRKCAFESRFSQEVKKKKPACFLALKTSAELRDTVPAQNIKNHKITINQISIHFLKSRYFNLKINESHNPECHDMVQTRAKLLPINPSPHQQSF